MKTHVVAGQGRVLLLPATRRDGEAICAVLDKESVDCLVCHDATEVASELEKGAATLVLTDSALVNADGSRIVASLLQQPNWSDIPVVLLRKRECAPDTDKLIARMTNVTVLERPTSSRTLLSAIRTSLRARARQYEMRDHVAALGEAEDELRQADRRKDEFLAMLAHELRNPLAPIRAATDLLPRLIPAGDERVDSTLRMVRRQVGQLSRLVEDLLDVSRITQGRIELQSEIMDLATVVAQARESVEPLLAAKQLKVHSSLGFEPLHVRGDKARLVQCVSNILTNSAKYTDDGGKIEIALLQESGWASIVVSDDGIGVEPELLPKVFDLFVQSQQALDRSQGGLGIGLSVVRRLVRMHGGEVTARSPGLGQGATFEIRLPLVPESPQETNAPVVSRGPRKRVLVVDDNRDAADSLAMLLRSHGHEVQIAYDGEEALDIAAREAADLVLLDIGLPTMDGYEVARRLRAAGTSARLVALTGYGQPEDQRRAMEAGFDAHMVKPVDVDRILDALGQQEL